MRLYGIALLAALLCCAGCANNNAAATKPATKAPAATPGLGSTVKVGDLDLTVTAVHAIDTTPFNQFNTADTGVDVQATNARGGSGNYDFNPFLALKLVDTNGVAHQPELACAGCPNEIQDTQLTPKGHIQGTVYFKLGGATPAAVQYQAPFSTNKATIPVAQ